ncbi:MAG: hypothetical protein IKB06_01745 [Clostridia bacterium]|nr:hypothetical protein [Clostridia bacterium]
MEDIYSFELESDVFEKVLAGKKTAQLAVNDNKRKVYAVGNQITFVCKAEEGASQEEKKTVKVVIENLLYFADVKEAVETLGKEQCGFKPSATFEKASDLFLSNENFETIEKFGIVAIVFKLLEQ